MAAEQLPQIEAHRIDQLSQERLSQLRFRKFIGSVALGEDILTEEISPEETSSLHESIIGASKGDPEALASVHSNAKTAATESVYKSAHVMEVKAKRSREGSIIQHGQKMMGVYRNALIYSSGQPEFQERLIVEALNGHRIEDLMQLGLLEDHWVVVPSLYPDNMTKTEATANGFFSDTLTGVFQGTTASEDEITIQSAFVSGTHNPSEVNNDERPDIDAIKKVYEHLGFDVSNMSVTELLGTPLLIHKKYMPNGIVDFVELFDKVNGTFFGRKDLPKVGYQEQIKISAEREARLEPSTIEIDEELIASADQLQDPTDASKLLYKLVADKVIKLAGEDNTIDETVFGSEAAPLIRHARLLKSKGFDDGARYILQKAREVAIVTMCGIGGKSDQNLLGEDQQTLKEDGEINLENVENMNGNIRCYKCREKVPKRKVVKKSRGTWCCPKCHYEVDVCTGSIKNEGIPTKKISLTKILAPAA